jgi:hypothetical protein
MDFIHSVVLATHFIGMAIIVGPFLMQMRSRANFAFNWVFGGTIVQLASGLELVVLLELAATPDEPVNHAKVGVKLTIELLAFISALIGWRRQRKSAGDTVERSLMPFFHSAGGLAVINMLVAVFW